MGENLKSGRKKYHCFLAGLVSGTVIAGLFNPWDRALYLSVIHKRRFLHNQNWRNPYLGFQQAVAQRVLSGGLYFTLQGFIIDNLDSPTPVAVGLLAGLGNGMIMNPIAIIKYQTWQNKMNFVQVARDKWLKGGLRAFLTGTTSTCTRDVVFGITYEVGRQSMRARSDEKHAFACNLAAGFLATCLSSPFNYLRSMQYATDPAKRPRPALDQLQVLWVNALRDPAPLRYLGERLRVGWGTLRVGVGMATGQFLFDGVMRTMRGHELELKTPREKT
eukprot:g48744.t1